MYLHGSKSAALAPPTEHQFQSLLDFLLSPEPDFASSPLPITINKDNRWRLHPYDAMSEHHIFKNRCDIPIEEPIGHCEYLFLRSDWPEIEDYELCSVELRKKEAGEPYDEDLLKTSWDRLARTITPTSRYWDRFEAEVIRTQPDGKKQRRPPYFFDA
jgi:hypothetical protein